MSWMLSLTLMTVATFLILIFGGRAKIRDWSVAPATIFLWLACVTYLSLLLSSPYFLFLLFLSIYFTKLFIKSSLWQRFMRYSLYILLFIMLFNLLLVQNGTHIIFENSLLRITWESLAYAYSMGTRILIVMGAFSIFDSNVSMDEVIEILERFRFPQSTLITLSLSLRFFSILAEDASQTMDVLRLRGVPLSSGKLRERVRARYPVMLSLLNSSMERSIQVAEALEVKGFPSSKRRAWRRIPFPRRELLISSLLLSAGIIATLLLLLWGAGSELLNPEHILHFPISLSPLLILLSRREEDD